VIFFEKRNQTALLSCFVGVSEKPFFCKNGGRDVSPKRKILKESKKRKEREGSAGKIERKRNKRLNPQNNFSSHRKQKISI